MKIPKLLVDLIGAYIKVNKVTVRVKRQAVKLNGGQFVIFMAIANK